MRDARIDELRSWIKAEYDRRTAAVEAGNVSPRDIVWLSPQGRVQFSEVTTKAEELGLKMDVVSLRLAVAGAIPV